MAKSSFGLRVRTGTIEVGGLSTNSATMSLLGQRPQIIQSPLPQSVPPTAGIVVPTVGAISILPLPSPLPEVPLAFNVNTISAASTMWRPSSPTVRGDEESPSAQFRPGVGSIREQLASSGIQQYIDNHQSVLGMATPRQLGLNPNTDVELDGDGNPRPRQRATALTPQFTILPMFPVYRTFPITQIEPSILLPDSLQLSEFRINNGSVVTAFKTQTVKRPTIIALSGYNKVFQEDLVQLTNAGKLVAFNFQSRILRDDMVKTMYDFVSKNSDSEDVGVQLRQDEQRDLDSLSDSNRLLGFYNQSVAIVQNIKKGFDIKSLPDSAYTDGTMLNLPDFFERKMRFSRQSYATFSDTKILSQLLFDYRSMMETYSLSLLDTLDSDRTNDLSPIRIDKSYGNTNRFTFTIVGIQGSLPYLESSFNGFQNSLPTSPDDRIKLLFNTLTKELRVSRGLSQPEIRNLLGNYFGGNADGDPFDNVVGNVGTDIFVAPQGFNSLASLLQFSREDVVTVLPFERKVVDDNQTIYMPGSRYFIDTLLERDPKTELFNTRPLDEYTQRFSEVVSNAKRVVDELFEFTTTTQTLKNEVAFKTFLNYIKNGTSSFESKSTPSSSQLFTVAILRLADTNKQLKLMLFQFFLLYGLTKNVSEARKPIFTRLANELQGIGSLSFVRGFGNPNLQNGTDELSPYLDTLAGDIASKIIELITSNDSALSTLRNFDRRTQSPINGVSFQDVVNEGLVDSGLTLNPTSNASNNASSENPGTAGSSRITIDFTTIKATLLSSVGSNLLTNFPDYMHSLDQAATIVDNQNSYVIGGAGGNATTTRYNQLTTSMLMMLAFESMCSFTAKYYEIDFLKFPTGVTILSYDVQLISGVWELLYTLSPTTASASAKSRVGDRFKKNKVTTRQNSKQRLGATKKRGAGHLNPNTDVELDVDGNPRPKTSQSSSDATDSNNENTLDLSPSLRGLVREATDALPEFQNRTAGSNPLLRSKIQSLRDSITSMVQRLIEEDNTIKNVVYIFDVLGDVLKRTSDQARQLNQLAEQNASLESIKSSILPSQLRISNWIYSEYKKMISDPTIQFRSRVVTPNDWNMLLSLLKEKPFQNNFASTRTKLLVVGVPKGYTDYLQDRIDRSSSDDVQKLSTTQESDVVNIVVYKKTAEDDDIVFYPQKFTFDLSLFRTQFNSDEAAIDQTQSFDSILRQVTLTDFSTDLENNRDGKKYTLDKLMAEERWNFLGSDQKLALFRNHMTSYALSNYLYLSTGMRMTEEVFPDDAYRNYTNNTGWLIREFHRLRTGEDIEDIRSLMATQQYNFLYSATSGFSPEYIRERTLGQKKFDRVFILPIDIDSFLVDRVATQQTQSGRNAVGSNRFQQRTTEARPGDNELLYFDRSSEPNALIFEQYYVTVESVR